MEPILTALPVMLSLKGQHADGLRRWVEGVLGWQAVDADTAGLVPPALEICDIASADDPGAAHVPRLLLVDDGDPPDVAAMAAARASPHAVVAWPSGRDRIAELATEAVSAPRPSTRAVRRLRLGGSAGGVGTTTVALALAGLAAWSGARTLVAVRGTGLGFRQLPVAALSGRDVWARADVLPGVRHARAVHVVEGEVAGELTDPRVEVFVEDVGVEVDVDLLVCRRDAAGLAALTMTTAAVVVVVGDGPVGADRLRTAAEGRRTIAVAVSARVARAALRGRVPADLPGAWLRPLAPLVPAGAARRSPVRDTTPLAGPRAGAGVAGR